MRRRRRNKCCGGGHTATKCQRLPIQNHLHDDKRAAAEERWRKEHSWRPWEGRELPNQMFYEMNMKNTALQNLRHGEDLLKKNVVLLLFPSRWPLSQIPHGTAWAHLTWPPLAHSVAPVRDPSAAKWKFKWKPRSLLSFGMHWLCCVCPQWLTLLSLRLIHCHATENPA